MTSHVNDVNSEELWCGDLFQSMRQLLRLVPVPAYYTFNFIPLNYLDNDGKCSRWSS